MFHHHMPKSNNFKPAIALPLRPKSNPSYSVNSKTLDSVTYSKWYHILNQLESEFSSSNSGLQKTVEAIQIK